MKSLFKKIAIVSLVFMTVLALSVHAAHAQTSVGSAIVGSLIGGVSTAALVWILAGVSWAILSVLSMLLSFAGTLMNVGMFMTTHLDLFINQTPVIYTVWSIIRDLASIILIFFILYAAIRMILFSEQPGYGNLIKNIIIIGVLINFSFFFTRVLIDFSNIISLEFYNAVAPGNSASVQTANVTNLSRLVPQLLTSGGLSDVLMSSLKIPSWWAANGPTASMLTPGDNVATALDILIKTVAGIIVTLLTAISFFIAAMSTVYRIAVLVFLLAFSPIWIAAMAMPQLKPFADRWWKQFYAQLVFLPVYLAFMYVALEVITSTQLNSMVSTQANPGMTNVINLFVGFAIMIVLLNIPFVAAVSVSGGMSWTDKWFEGVRGWMTKKVQGNAKVLGGWATRGTFSRAASAIARNESFKDAASRSGLAGNISRLAYKGTLGVASDYEKKLKEQVESRTAFADKLGYNQVNMNRAQTALRLAEQNLASQKALGLTGRFLLPYENAVSAAKLAVTRVETDRKSTYAADLNTLGAFSGAQTLWTKVARKDKVAAAKIQIPLTEKQLERQKESLKDTRDDIKQLTKAVQNSPGGMASISGAQQTRLNQLYGDEQRKLTALNATQAQIDQLKLIK